MFDIWHLGLPVRSLTESVRFYVEGLGMELLGYYDTERYKIAFVRVPGKSFTIELLEYRNATAEDLAKKPDHLAFECADLDGFREGLLKRGFFTELPAIADVNDGMRRFAVTDPNGVPVQFYKGREAFDRSIGSAMPSGVMSTDSPPSAVKPER